MILWALLLSLGVLRHGSALNRQAQAFLGLPAHGALQLQSAAFLGRAAVFALGALVIAGIHGLTPFLTALYRPDLQWGSSDLVDLAPRVLAGALSGLVVLSLAQVVFAVLRRVLGGIVLVAAVCLSGHLSAPGAGTLIEGILDVVALAFPPLETRSVLGWSGAVQLGYIFTYNLLAAMILGRRRGPWPSLDQKLSRS